MIQSFLQNHYNVIELEEGYEFTTDKGVKYYVSFISYPLIDDFLSVKTYMFNIERLSRPNEKKGQNDYKVKYTVLYVIYQFFKNHDDALITICDILDGKQFARKRLFDSWFNTYNDGSLIKLEAECRIEEDITYASLLYSSKNKHADKLIQSFEELTRMNFYN